MLLMQLMMIIFATMMVRQYWKTCHLAAAESDARAPNAYIHALKSPRA